LKVRVGEIDPETGLDVKRKPEGKFRMMNKGGMATQMEDAFDMQEDT